MLWSEASCIDGAGRRGVIGCNRAITDSLGEGLAGAVVDVPEIAEVDAVVQNAARLGAGVSGNGASIGSRGELEDLVVSVLSVLGQAGAPDVVVCFLFYPAVSALGGASLWRVPFLDQSGHGIEEAFASYFFEVGSDMAVSVHSVVRREIGLVSNRNGGKECGEGSHIYFSFI